MPATPTPKHGLHRPAGTDDADIPADLLQLTDELDDLLTPFDQGPIGARPAAGIPGRLYRSTDEGPGGAGILYLDVGVGWGPIAGAEAARVIGAGGQPAYGTGWSNGTWGNARFWKSGDRVYLAGSALRTSSGPETNAVAFTLPAGYRPPHNMLFPNSRLFDYDPGTATEVPYRINTDGTVQVAPVGATAARVIWLDGISFDTVR